MPGRLHKPDEDLPPVITADTSFWVALMDAADDAHERATVLYRRLWREQVIVVTCRPLLMTEFRTAVKKLANTLQPYRVDRLVDAAQLRQRMGQTSLFPAPRCPRRDDPGKRRYLMDAMDRLLASYQAPLRLARVRMTNALVERSKDEMSAWSQDSGDALHVAVSRVAGARAGIDPHILTNDAGFERVDGLQIWCRP